MTKAIIVILIVIIWLYAGVINRAANAMEITGWRCGNVVIDFTSGNIEESFFTFEIKGLKKPNPKFEWWWPLKEGEDKLMVRNARLVTR